MSATSLYVFFPTDIRPKALQKNINKLCPKVDTLVFGRINDYLHQLNNTSPDAILSPPPVVKIKTSYKTLLRGERNGRIDENYVLVSIDQPIKPKNIPSMKIGVVDILGRKPMKQFINKLLGSKIKLKRVTKIEDILPLLTFKMVRAVFIPERLFEQLKFTSKQHLVATQLDIQLKMVSAALKKQTNPQAMQDISQCLKQLDVATNRLFGVDQWKS